MHRQFRVEELNSLYFGGKAFFAIPSFLGTSSSSATSSSAAAAGASAARPRSSSSTSVVVGRHEFIRSLSHPHLCEEIELIRSKHDRIFLVSEHYTRTLRDVVRDCESQSTAASAICVPEARLTRFGAEILMALDYLARHGVVHRNLHLDNILIDPHDHVKLADYGMYYISNAGREVSVAALSSTETCVRCRSSLGVLVTWHQKCCCPVAARVQSGGRPDSNATSGRLASYCCRRVSERHSRTHSHLPALSDDVERAVHCDGSAHRVGCWHGRAAARRARRTRCKRAVNTPSML
jgi:serine/threonine protein kinase